MADLQGTGIIDTGFLRIPQGLTANRPGSPVVGLRYFNTSLNIVEWYNGTAWIPEILNVNNDPRVEIFNGGTSATIWTCPPNIYTVQALIVAGGGAGGSANSNCSPAGGGAVRARRRALLRSGQRVPHGQVPAGHHRRLGTSRSDGPAPR